jgi:lipoate-protein ligase B
LAFSKYPYICGTIVIPPSYGATVCPGIKLVLVNLIIALEEVVPTGTTKNLSSGNVVNPACTGVIVVSHKIAHVAVPVFNAVELIGVAIPVKNVVLVAKL